LHFRPTHNILHESMGSLLQVLDWPRYDSSRNNIYLGSFIIIIY